MSRSSGEANAAGETANYLASVSDLMSGLFFLFIITLMVFALGLRVREVEKEKEIKKLTGANDDRSAMLQDIHDQLVAQGIRVEVDAHQGVLRLGEGVLFESGKANLDAAGKNTLRILAQVLMTVLPCYSENNAAEFNPGCGQRGLNGKVDALFIEGHTDDRPIGFANSFKDNWDLSTARARTVYLGLIAEKIGLDSLRNREAQPLLSVSGYADRRGVIANDSEDNRRRNRRIDLRFVMVPPKDALPEPARETKESMEQKR